LPREAATCSPLEAVEGLRIAQRSSPGEFRDGAAGPRRSVCPPGEAATAADKYTAVTHHEREVSRQDEREFHQRQIVWERATGAPDGVVALVVSSAAGRTPISRGSSRNVERSTTTERTTILVPVLGFFLFPAARTRQNRQGHVSHSVPLLLSRAHSGSPH
jgi:hypothetical protein